MVSFLFHNKSSICQIKGRGWTVEVWLCSERVKAESGGEIIQRPSKNMSMTHLRITLQLLSQTILAVQANVFMVTSTAWARTGCVLQLLGLVAQSWNPVTRRLGLEDSIRFTYWWLENVRNNPHHLIDTLDLNLRALEVLLSRHKNAISNLG